MQFSEKELVDLLILNSDLEDHFSQWRVWNDGSFPNYSLSREITLKSGRRCDLILGSKNNRISWIIEAKVYADVNTLIQVLEYKDEFRATVQKNSKFKMTLCCIAAQFFKGDLLRLCRLLGVPCLHITPVNKDLCEFNFQVFNGPIFQRKQLGLHAKKLVPRG